MAAPPETTGAPPPTDREDGKDRVQVCLFDESPDVFSRAVRAISELADGDPDPSFPDAEVQRIASSVTFLREWRHFSYEPKGVSFTCNTGSVPSRDDTHKINLSQFSSASVPQTTHMEDARDNANSSDFILFAGGNVWALDWCPRLFDRPSSSINCEYLAVSAHPPGSSYHKIGMPLIGRGIIQIWCLVAPFEENQSMVACHKKSNRGRPRKNPDEISSVNSLSNPPKPRGRPRKRAITSSDDHPEPSVKKPRGRPRKYPLAIIEVEDSSQNSRSQDSGVIDPLLISTVIPYDPAVLSAELTPRKGRGRPRKKQSDKIKCLSGIKLKEDLSMDPSRTALICIEPKKKRGRPRKYPAPSNSNHLLGTEAPKPSSEPTNSDNLTALAETNGDIDLGSIGLARCNIEKCNDHLRVVTSDATSPDKNQLIKPFVKIKGLSGIELKEDLSRDPSPTALICMEPKKQRGVPWKYPAPSYSKHLSGTESPMPATEPTNSGNLTVLAETNGQIVASDLGSIGLARCNIEKCNVDLSVITSDATPTTHGLFNTKFKEEPTFKVYRRRPRKKPVSTVCGSTASNGEEQKTQIIPKSSDHVALVKNCMKESFPSMGRWQGEKVSASIESSSLPLSAEVHNMISCTAITPSCHLASLENSMPLGSCVSEDLANEVGLVGYKNGPVDVGVMKMCESNTVNYPSDCNTENAQANQVVPVPFENSVQVIDELEDPELAPFKESSKCDSTNGRAIAKDISLPRVVLCLAHNGKVAWDIKWKPPLENQSEQKSHLGFLAVLLGNGSIEVWKVPTPSMIQKIYSSSSKECTDPRFLKLQPVFRCAKVKCGNIQSIPLTVDWSPSPHDMILAGCHDGTVALWKFSTDLSSEVSKPFMCVTAESAPIRTLSWAPYMSEENVNTFVTAGEDGLKFWDLRDPYRPLWELTTAPRAVLSLQWLKDARGIVISLEDGTLKFVSLSRIANDVPVTGKPFNGTKTQGVSTYQLSEYSIWSVHASETTGYAAYCVADGTAVRFQLTPRFWEKEPGRNRVPYFLCGSLSEEGTDINVGVTAPNSSLSNVPLVAKKVTKSRQDVDQLHNMGNEKLLIDSELRDGQPDGPDEGQETGAIVLADPAMQENAGICNSRGVESPESFEVFPPKSVALHRLRWNMNKGSERWLCYGGAAGIIRCQRI